jgi:hypothetical protein
VGEGIGVGVAGADEENAGGERGLWGGVEDALAGGAEAAESDADGEGDAGFGGGGIELGDVGRKGGAFGAVYGDLGPGLGGTPEGEARNGKLCGGLAM